MFRAKRILVAVDFSPESDRTVDWAVGIAQEQRGASIDLVHVIPRTRAPVGPEAGAYYDFFTVEKKTCQTKLAQLQKRIPKTIASSYSIREGETADQIKKVCEAEKIDLVVMTTHGRRGLSRLINGSTSEETVRMAPCPVLVLHLNQVGAPVPDRG